MSEQGEGVLASLRRDLRARERLVERHQRPSEVLKTLASQAANMNGENENEREEGDRQ